MVKRLDIWSAAGLGYSLGQFFMTKYTVFYGLPSALAKLDQVYAPDPPKCIGRIHLYSQMWRDFDRGFYNFMIRSKLLNYTHYFLNLLSISCLQIHLCPFQAGIKRCLLETYRFRFVFQFCMHLARRFHFSGKYGRAILDKRFHNNFSWHEISLFRLYGVYATTWVFVLKWLQFKCLKYLRFQFGRCFRIHFIHSFFKIYIKKKYILVIKGQLDGSKLVAVSSSCLFTSSTDVGSIKFLLLYWRKRWFHSCQKSYFRRFDSIKYYE